MCHCCKGVLRRELGCFISFIAEVVLDVLWRSCDDSPLILLVISTPYHRGGTFQDEWEKMRSFRNKGLIIVSDFDRVRGTRREERSTRPALHKTTFALFYSRDSATPVAPHDVTPLLVPTTAGGDLIL